MQHPILKQALIASCMLSAASITDAAIAADQEPVGPGACFYADRFAPQLEQGVIFADCDAVSIRKTGLEAVFLFSHSRRERRMEFKASLIEETWAVTAIRLRSGDWREATGGCTIYRREAAISTVTCVTTKGARLYAANFVELND